MKIIQQFTKYHKDFDNVGRTVMDSKKYHKSIDKLYKLDVKYKSVREDPYMRKYIMFSPQYLIQTQSLPDDDEIIKDYDSFNFISYIKFLLQAKYQTLEPADIFPYTALKFLIIYGFFQLVFHSYLWFYRNEFEQEKKEKIQEYYDYKRFEDDLRFSMLLFQRSTEI